MIASVRGAVLAAGDGRLVVEVGGVGLAVFVPVPLAASARVGDEMFVHTELIVRDDELSLYGFATTEELAVFALLRSVGGVGPKSALGVLSALTPDDVAIAVASEDDAPFRRVSGIGPKTAKLIVVTLTGKIAAPSSPPAPSARPAASTPEFDSTGSSVATAVITGLVGLGWTEKLASATVRDLLVADPEADASRLLRAALATQVTAVPGGWM